MTIKEHQKYYVPESSYWPIIGAIGLILFAIGAVGLFQSKPHGPYLFTAGVLVLIFMMCGWFSHIIHESLSGLYSRQMDRTFRWGMGWFIFSEVMFFAVFFGALYYARVLSVPWLAGFGHKVATHEFLWENFKAAWPLLSNPSPNIVGPIKAMGPWPLPAINTLILLTSGATITWAHHALLKKRNGCLVIGLGLTILLGVLFLFFQAHEYREAYVDFKLTLNSGIYGTTFFMLTGFHGLHVTIGTLMLIVIWLRSMKGHFTPKNHFAFEAAAWYWHFVDVVWLILFVFVYWL